MSTPVQTNDSFCQKRFFILVVILFLLEMQKHKKITVERLEKFHTTQSWTDVNLRSMLYPKKRNIAADVTVFSVPGLERMPYAQAVKSNNFVSFDQNTAKFGPR